MLASSEGDRIARDSFGRAHHADRLWRRRLLSFFMLISVIVGLFYLMWLLSPGYPIELSLLGENA